jgi:CBS domain containing-hemolysin-like protein
MVLLVFWVALAILLTHLCSLLESVTMSVRLSTLVEQRAAGHRGARRLLQIKRTRLEDAISTILILNTSASTLGATCAGAQATIVFGDAWVGIFSGCLTLIIAQICISKISQPSSQGFL